MELCTWCLKSKKQERIADEYCIDCKRFLCVSCSRSHNHKSSHTILPIKTVQFCEECNHANAFGHCRNCRRYLCDICVVKHETSYSTKDHKINKLGADGTNVACNEVNDDDVGDVLGENMRGFPDTPILECSSIVYFDPSPISDAPCASPHETACTASEGYDRTNVARENETYDEIDDTAITEVCIPTDVKSSHSNETSKKDDTIASRNLDTQSSRNSEKVSVAYNRAEVSHQEPRASSLRAYSHVKLPKTTETSANSEYIVLRKQDSPSSPNSDNVFIVYSRCQVSHQEPPPSPNRSSSHNDGYYVTLDNTDTTPLSITLMQVLPDGNMLLYDDANTQLMIYDAKLIKHRWSQKLDSKLLNVCSWVAGTDIRIYAALHGTGPRELFYFLMHPKSQKLCKKKSIEINYQCFGLTICRSELAAIENKRQEIITLHFYDNKHNEKKSLQINLGISFFSKLKRHHTDTNVRFSLATIDNGNLLVLSDCKYSCVSIVDIDTGNVVLKHTDDLLIGPSRVVTDLDDKIYVLCKGSKNIHALCRATGSDKTKKLTGRVILVLKDRMPDGICFHPLEDVLYISQPQTNKIRLCKLI